ncbi:MAG: hypothetical protein JWR49_3819 [Tardiphaga sp.]|jgi:hypothetical protein|nr:hypothetical protein [Tardiphaga sp.]
MNSLNAPNVFLRNDLMDDLFRRMAKSDIRCGKIEPFTTHDQATRLRDRTSS